MIKKKTKAAYFYTVKELSYEKFQSKKLFSFFEAYQKIFLAKASFLQDNSDEKIINLCDCGVSGLNKKITGHVLNAKNYVHRLGKRFNLSTYLDLFSITWKVKIEAVDRVYVEQVLGPNNELYACSNVYKIFWQYPILEEKRDFEGKLYWIKDHWSTFEIFFDMDGLQSRFSSKATFKNEAKLTVSPTKVTFALKYEFE